MRITVFIETTEGEFSIMREIKPLTEATPGLMGVFGAKSTATDAHIGEARAVLDVLPTIITAVNSEYADIAAQKTRQERAEIEKKHADETAQREAREKEVREKVMALVCTGVRTGRRRYDVVKEARALGAQAGVRFTLTELVAMWRDEEQRLARIEQIAKEADEYAIRETPDEGPEVLIGDGEGEPLPPIKDDEPAF